MFEGSLRQTLLMYKANLSVLLTSPIALVFVILTVGSIWRFARRR
jgi:TctA family transporter